MERISNIYNHSETVELLSLKSSNFRYSLIDEYLLRCDVKAENIDQMFES